MITNEIEYREAIRRIAILDAGLEEVGQIAVGERASHYRPAASGYIAEIRKLQDEIQAYLQVRTIEKVPFRVRAAGSATGAGRIPAKKLSELLKALQEAANSEFKRLFGPDASSESELLVVAGATGSYVIGMEIENPEQLPLSETPGGKAVRALVHRVQAVQSGQLDPSTSSDYAALKKLANQIDGRSVRMIEFSFEEADSTDAAVLDSRGKETLAQKLQSTQPDETEVEGELYRLNIHSRECGVTTASGNEDFTFSEELKPEVIANIGSQVLVRGIRQSPGGKSKMTMIEGLD